MDQPANEAPKGAQNDDPNEAVQETGAAAQPSSAASTGGHSKTSPTITLQDLLASSQKTAALQQSFKSTYQNLPTVLEIAGQILKKKNEGDAALNEGMKVVENVLQEANEKADALSQDLQKHMELLKSALQDKDTLMDLMKSGSRGAGTKSDPGTSSQNASSLGGGVADPKIAYQLNLLMGNVQSMVAREVENQLSQLRAQAEKMMQQGK